MTSKALVIERTFDASVEKVWKSWTDPEEFKKWWGPKDFTAPSITMDFSEGGKYLWCMRGAPGPDAPIRDFWSTGTYKVIVPLKQIVYTDSFADEQGKVVSADHYGMPGLPMEFEVRVMFDELPDGKTKMTLTHVGMPAGPNQEGASAGWNQSFDKLAASLS